MQRSTTPDPGTDQAVDTTTLTSTLTLLVTVISDFPPYNPSPGSHGGGSLSIGSPVSLAWATSSNKPVLLCYKPPFMSHLALMGAGKWTSSVQ